jgi:hypothetical protein
VEGRSKSTPARIRRTERGQLKEPLRPAIPGSFKK